MYVQSQEEWSPIIDAALAIHVIFDVVYILFLELLLLERLKNVANNFGRVMILI